MFLNLLMGALLMAPVKLAGDGDARPRIVVLDIVNGAGLEAQVMEALHDAVLTAIAGAPVEVLSTADLRRALDFNQMQESLGCHRDDCLLNLAESLDARYVMSGSLAGFDGRFIMNLKLIDTRADRVSVLLRQTHEAEPGAMTALARVSAAKMRQALGGPAPNEAEMAVLSSRMPVAGFSLALATVAVGGVSVYYAFQANKLYGQAVDDHANDPVAGPHLIERGDDHAQVATLAGVGSGLLAGAAVAAWMMWW